MNEWNDLLWYEKALFIMGASASVVLLAALVTFAVVLFAKVLYMVLTVIAIEANMVH